MAERFDTVPRRSRRIHDRGGESLNNTTAQSTEDVHDDIEPPIVVEVSHRRAAGDMGRSKNDPAPVTTRNRPPP